MGLKLCSLSSGSRGNCILVASETTSLIVDAGISVSLVSKGLKLLGLSSPGILITHAHSDHVANLCALTKKYAPDVFCHKDSFAAVNTKVRGGRLIPVDGDFFVGDLTVSPFKVSHDVPCVGYSIYNAGRKVSIVTDLGQVDEYALSALSGSDIVFIEANHDEDMVLGNPSYPYALKKRILSGKGHLSNTACALALLKIAKSGVKQVILGHLSQENNYPELAHGTVSRILTENGIKEGRDISIAVAGFCKPSNVFEVV